MSRRQLPVISATAVDRFYGQRRVLAGVDLDVTKGEIVAILGPNGAGKTTLVEILEGLRRRDGGTIEVLGEDPESASAAWRSRIGAVLQLGLESDEFTVGEMLRAHAAYYPRAHPVGDVVSLLDLSELVDRRVSQLSGGQRRRLDVALGIVGRPELLFLDEPTTGLDPEVRRSIWDIVRRLADEGTTVLLTTHYLDEVDHLADRTIVLIDGATVWEGQTDELTTADATSNVSFRLRRPATAADLPTTLPRPVSTSGGSLTFQVDDPNHFVAELMAWADQAAGDPVEHLEITGPSLEDAYLDLLETAQAQKRSRT